MSYNRPTGEVSGGASPMKIRIDKFIGLIPELHRLDKEEYQKFSNNFANENYWLGYLEAKIELRDKLYEKENIKIPENGKIYGSSIDLKKKYTPEENISLYGGNL